MLLDVPIGIVMALTVNVLVGIYFYAMYQKQNKHRSYLHWSISCGLFASGLIAAVAAYFYTQWPVLNTVACLLLYASTYGLLVGLNSFELARRSSLLFQKAQSLFFAGLGAIAIAGFYDQFVNVTTSVLMAVMLLMAEGYFYDRASNPKPIYIALRVVLLLHAFVLFLQGVVLLTMTLSTNDSTFASLYKAALLSHLILVIATALLLPLLQLLRQRRYWKKQANTDHLTGFLSRRAFTQHAYQSLASRKSTPHSLLMIDVDHFKAINDTHGHPQGDEVLKCIAKAISNGVRESDLIGRLGGEEFVILMPETTQASAHEIAERLRHSVTNLKIKSHNELINVTVSIGIASSSELSNNWDLLLENADRALYFAKNEGRNMVYKFDSSQPTFCNP